MARVYRPVVPESVWRLVLAGAVMLLLVMNGAMSVRRFRALRRAERPIPTSLKVALVAFFVAAAGGALVVLADVFGW